MFRILCFTGLAIILMAVMVHAAPLHIEPDKAPSIDGPISKDLPAFELPSLQLDALLENKNELQRQNLLIPYFPDLVATSQDPAEFEYRLPSLRIENANDMDRYHPWLKLNKIDWTSPDDYQSKIMMKRFLRQPVSWPED